MEVEFELTEEDFVAFQEYTVERTDAPRERRQRWFICGVGLALLVCLIATRYLESDNFNLMDSRTFYPAAFLVAIIGHYLIPILFGRSLARRSIRQTFQQSGNALALARRRMRVSSEGMSERTEFGTTTVLPWITIRRIEFTPDHAFFYLPETQAFVLPRRAFTTEDEFRRFVEAARQFHTQAGLRKWSKDQPSSDPSQVTKGETDPPKV